MAVLTINWGSDSRVSPRNAVITANEADEQQKENADAPKPHADKAMLVYVQDNSTEEQAFDKIEKVVLADDKVAIGSNAFRCVKISAEDAEKDPLLQGKELPRFVFLSPSYDVVEVLEGRKISVSGMYGAMKKAAKASYSTDFDKNVRALLKLLNEFDKINNERKVLDAKIERETKPTPADERKFAEAKKELDERQSKAEDERKELLSFEIRV
jgi:hypothetical protein